MSTKAHSSYTIIDVIDGLQWQGSLSTAPTNPQIGWAYYNTTTKESYIYDGNQWVVFAKDGAGVKKINTNLRQFTRAQWVSYGTPGVITPWTANRSENSHISIGDTAYIIGEATDITSSNKSVSLYGVVTQITDTLIYMEASYLIMGAEDGNGISEKSTQYYESTSYEELTGGSWSDTPPASWTGATYVWTRIKETWTKKDENGELVVTYTSPELMSRIQLVTIMAQKAGISIGEWCEQHKVTIVENGMIAAGSIESDKLKAKTLSAIRADMGEIIAGSIEGNYQPSSITIWGETAPQEGFAQDTSEDLTYELNDDDTYTVSGLNAKGTQIFIPYAYNNKRVTRIAEEGFANKTSITSVRLSDGIQSIGASAFAGCTNLELIYLPDTLTAIGNEAFIGCPITKIFYQGTEEHLITLLKLDYPIEGSLIVPGIIGKPNESARPEGGWYISSKSFEKTYSTTNGDPIVSATINETKLTNTNQIVFTENLQLYQNVTCYIYARLEDGKIIYYRYLGGWVDSKSISISCETTTLSFVGTARQVIPPTYYYSATEPEEGNFWHYSGAQGFKISCNDEYMIDSPYFKVTQDGQINATDGIFKGNIEAYRGRIGGLIIQDNGIFSTIDDKQGLLLLADGTVESQTFNTDSLNIHQITSRSNGNTTSLNFEELEGVYETKQVYVNITHQVISEGEYADNFWNGLVIKNAGQVTIKIKLDEALPSDVQVILRPKYLIDGYANSTTSGADIHVTIPATQTEVQTSCDNLVEYIIKNGNVITHDYLARFHEIQLISPSSYPKKQLTDQNKGVITCKGHFYPEADGMYNLGKNDSAQRWHYIYCVNSTGGSDRKIKDNIIDIDKEFSKQLISGLSPSAYTLKTAKTPRTHYGFIAQDVEKLLVSLGTSTDEIGLVCKSLPQEPDGENNHYSLNYINLIAPMVSVIQQLLNRVENLEDKLEAQQNDSSN